MTGSAERAPSGRRFERGGEEFSRVLAFSDGLFAIAMTLLVVGVSVPVLSDAASTSELADALNDRSNQIFSFFISFAVIGRYWLAHHQMFSLLGAMDRALIGLNLVYLALIAFLPFPTAILGRYFDNPLSVSLYAVGVGLISGLEVALLRRAHRHGLLADRMPEDVYRWGRGASLLPVVLFAISIPIAFWAGSTVAVLVWLLNVPAGIAINRRAPAGVGAYFT